MVQRLLSLAAGSLPEFSPVEVVHAAAEAGWPACGIWFEAKDWTAHTTAQVRTAFESSGLVPLDIEVVWIHPGDPDPDHERQIAAGGEIGARNVLIVSSDPNREATKRRFEQLCDLAQTAGMNACLEFLPITEIKSLADARDVVEAVAHPAGRILIDPVHLARSGGTPDDVAATPASLFSYAQFCDGPATLPDQEMETILTDAVDGRLMPGAGGLPLAALLEALAPDLPLSVEMRSKSVRDAYADATARARAILKATQAFVGQGG